MESILCPKEPLPRAIIFGVPSLVMPPSENVYSEGVGGNKWAKRKKTIGGSVFGCLQQCWRRGVGALSITAMRHIIIHISLESPTSTPIHSAKAVLSFPACNHTALLPASVVLWSCGNLAVVWGEEGSLLGVYNGVRDRGEGYEFHGGRITQGTLHRDPPRRHPQRQQPLHVPSHYRGIPSARSQLAQARLPLPAFHPAPPTVLYTISIEMYCNRVEHSTTRRLLAKNSRLTIKFNVGNLDTFSSFYATQIFSL